MKKQYIIPILNIESVEALQAMLGGFSIGPKPQPGAPARQGDSSVKITKMYI